MKLKRNTASNNKMTLYWWTHWFWITALYSHVTVSLPVPFSSLETISTSLKSALVQNDNSFQQTGEQQKIATGSKVAVPLTFETSDSDGVFGGADEVNAENIAKNDDWLVKPVSNKSNLDLSSSTTTSTTTSTEKPKLISVKLEQSQNIPPNVIASLNNGGRNVNSTNATQTTTIATTMLASVTESNISSFLKTSTTPTTKLIPISKERAKLEVEHIEGNLSDATEGNLNDSINDTMEIVMTDDSNATEITELSERKSKGLSGFSEEAKILNNISSRSTFQITHKSQNDDRLSSEALYDSDTDNNGITMSAGIISIICVGIIGSLSSFGFIFVYVYRRRYLNKPQALSEPDSSGYIEDSIRDNSDELYSLDNDSFLNSLEAMTIQNYWTDSVKHTKL